MEQDYIGLAFLYLAGVVGKMEDESLLLRLTVNG
jgi:hypothetical protein